MKSLKQHNAKLAPTERQLNKLLREIYAISSAPPLPPMPAKVGPFVRKKPSENQKPIGVVRYHKSEMFRGADVSQSKKNRRK